MNKLQIENNKRLEVLHRKHYKWLLGAGYKITKNREITKELIQELYLYLGTNPNSNLYFEDNFNLLYCRAFLSSRYINRVKRDKKSVEYKPIPQVDEEYDYDTDQRLEEAHQSVVEELKRLEGTKNWVGSQLAQLYFFGDFTLDGLAQEIGLSKSTCFLQVKKIKHLLKETLDNPFNKQ